VTLEAPEAMVVPTTAAVAEIKEEDENESQLCSGRFLLRESKKKRIAHQPSFLSPPQHP